MNSGAQGEAKTAEQASQQAALCAENVLALLRAEPNAALGQPIPMPRIGGDPPTEFRAFKWGDNPTTKGLLKLTPDGARLTMDEFRRRGVALCFDYFHATYNPAAPADSRKAAGQTIPEIRPDGLWYTQIQWTPAADRAIRDGEWPFISPGVLHDKKTGEIVALKNPGLVTDPGIIGAIPTVLSGSDAASPSKENTPMADKKRMTLDAYAAVQTALKRCQALGDTDGSEKDLGNRAVGHLVTLADMFSSMMGPAGMLEDGAAVAKLEAGRDRLFSALSDELGETDPDKLHGKLLVRLDGTNKPAQLPEGSVLLSKEDAALNSRLLLDGHDQKVPTSRRAALEVAPLGTVLTFLSSAQNITPAAAPVREAPPIAPTTEATKQAMSQSQNSTTSLAGNASGKTYAQLSADERRRVDEVVAAERKLRPADFNEQTARESVMALMSDYEEPTDSVTRHMPVGGVDGRPPVEVR